MTNWKKMSFLDSTRKSEDRLELWKNSRSSLALMVLRLLFPSCGICWGAVPFFLLSNYSASTLLLTKSCTFPQRFNLFIPKNTGSVFSPMPKMTYPALLTRSDQIWNFEASTSIRFTMIQDLIFKIFFNTPREKLTTQTSRAGKLYTHELLDSRFNSFRIFNPFEWKVRESFFFKKPLVAVVHQCNLWEIQSRRKRYPNVSQRYAQLFLLDLTQSPVKSS